MLVSSRSWFEALPWLSAFAFCHNGRGAIGVDGVFRRALSSSTKYVSTPMLGDELASVIWSLPPSGPSSSVPFRISVNRLPSYSAKSSTGRSGGWSSPKKGIFPASLTPFPAAQPMILDTCSHEYLHRCERTWPNRRLRHKLSDLVSRALENCIEIIIHCRLIINTFEPVNSESLTGAYQRHDAIKQMTSTVLRITWPEIKWRNTQTFAARKNALVHARLHSLPNLKLFFYLILLEPPIGSKLHTPFG